MRTGRAAIAVGTAVAALVAGWGTLAPAGASGTGGTGATAVFNWVLVTVKAKGDVSQFDLSLTLAGARAHAGNDAVGVATSAPRIGSDFAVYGQGFAGMSEQPDLSTSGGAGGLGLSLRQVPGPILGQAGWQCFCSLHGGEVARYLVFETDARWTSVTASLAAAEADVAVIKGFGATAVTVADPAATGNAVALPVLAAATSTLTRRMPTGVVGAVNGACLAGTCAASWTAPDGRHATAQDHAGFAGGAGTWRFTWSGVTNDPILAAWAPIGANWQSFR